MFFLCAVVLCMGAALVAYRAVSDLEPRTQELLKANAVLLHLEQAQAHLHNLVANARSYALSARQESLLSVERERSALFDRLDGLRGLLRDQPQQLDQLAALNAAIVKRIEQARIMMDAERRAQLGNIYEYGRDLGDGISKQIAQLQSRQQQVQTSAAALVKSGQQTLILSIVGAAMISLLVLIAVYLRLKRELLTSKEAQTRARLAEIAAEALYQQAPCGYHTVNEQTGLITRINDTELTWLGYSRAQVIGKMTPADLMTVASAADYGRTMRPRLLAGKTLGNMALEYRHADGKPFAVLLSAGTGELDTSGALLSHHVVHDVAERRRAQQQLDQLNASQLRHAQQLTNITKELESFSYSVSHDLRAPLRAISGYALMIEEDYGAALDDKGLELLQVISKNVKKMDALINDLLKLSKATTAELSLSSYSMHEQVKQVVATLRTQHSKVEFFIEPLENAPANAVLLMQVWENLLDNAVKFSSKTAQPLVRVSAQATPQEVIYRVHDNGIGFDMRYVHKLFGTFQRLHRHDEFTGSGVGLALVQRIVMRHGGRVWAESVPGEGASFYFALPRATS
jgi:PAS domain S-box-containing protein